MQPVLPGLNPQPKPSLRAPGAKVLPPCSECKRLKLKCDGNVPCSSCIRRGCASICPDAKLTTSQVSGVPETLYLQKITQMSDRIQQLEEALANLQSTLSNEPHPLLTDELLKIKYLSERPESEEFLASQDLSIMGQPTRPEGGEINIDVIRDADATSFHSSEDKEGKKQPTSNPSVDQLPPLQQLQLRPPQLAAVKLSPEQSGFILGHSQQRSISNYSDDTTFLPFPSSSVRPDPLDTPKRGLDEGFDSDKHKTMRRRSAVVCARCKSLKMKCNFITDPRTCERCLAGCHECIIPGQKSSLALKQERLTSQIRSQVDQVKELIVQIESVSQSPEHPPNLEPSFTALQPSSSSTGTKEDPSYGLHSTDSKRVLDEWIAKAKDSFLQFEDSIPKSHVLKNDPNLTQKQPVGACARCKMLKVKCEFLTGSATCKRCLRGGHECVIPGRSALLKRERLINRIRTQADKINQLMSKLELVQQPPEETPNLENYLSTTSAYHPHSQHSLPNTVPVSKKVNPRIEEWLSGAKQNFLQFEHFIPDLGSVEDDDSDWASWVDDDYEFSDFGPDADAGFPSHLQKQASHSSLNTAITSVAGSIGFPSKRGMDEAKNSALTALSSKDSEDWKFGGDSQGQKEREIEMGHLGQHFETRSAGIFTSTAHNTPALPLSTREDRLSAIFGPRIVGLALFNSHLNSVRPHCHSGTRENVLRKIRSCFRNTEGGDGLMFLRGAAGVGKTALMQTLAERESEDKRTLGTIFYEPKFSGDAGDFDRLVFPILAYQLALQDEPYANDIMAILDRHKSVLDESLQKQFDMLIAGPWARRGSEEIYIKPSLIILDGLDGRGMDKESFCEVVRLIGRYAWIVAPERISWIISNPPELLVLPSSLRVTEIEIPMDSDDACEDMEGFLRNEFDAISKRFPNRTLEQWPPEDDLLRVATATSGYFAFAISIIDFVGDPSIANPVDQLNAAIAYITGRSRNISPFATLDILYSDALQRASPLAISISMLLISLFLIPSVRFAKTPPSMVVACNILRLSKGVVHYSLSQLSALLDIPSDDSASTRPLKFLHSSFEDFLLNPARSGAQSIDLAANKVEIQQCCTAIAHQANGTPEKAGGLENIRLTWCPTDSDAGEERKKVYVFAARILGSLWEPELS